jgi:uncharacterized protein with HEPN domain
MNAHELRVFDYVDHMLDPITLAGTYVEGMNKTDFLDDRRTQQAAIMNILIIGEAATKLADKHPGFAVRYAHIPWDAMRGMCNRLAQGYFETNLDVVCNTLERDFPELEKALLKMRAENCS